MRVHWNVLLTKLTKPLFNQKIDIEIESDFFKYLVPVLRVFEWYKLKKWHPPWILKLFLCLKLNLRLLKLIGLISSRLLQSFGFSNFSSNFIEFIAHSSFQSAIWWLINLMFFMKVAWFQRVFFWLAPISKDAKSQGWAAFF